MHGFKIRVPNTMSIFPELFKGSAPHNQLGINVKMHKITVE